MNKEKKQNDFEIKYQEICIKKRTQIEYKELPLIVLIQARKEKKICFVDIYFVSFMIISFKKKAN